MKRTLLAGVLGGVILLVWGMLAWMLTPLHKDTVLNLPNEEAVVSALQATLPQQGVYYFPGMPKDQSDKAAMDAYTERYRRGPMGMVVYDPEEATRYGEQHDRRSSDLHPVGTCGNMDL